MLCCCSYSNPALAYTQQYNVGDTGPNGGTVTSSTLTSVVTNTEVTLNGGFEETTTTTNWTETVVEEISTSTTTTQQTSQITATTTSNFVPTINSSDWSTEGRIKLQGATQCRTGGSNATVGAGQACTGYQSNVSNNLIQGGTSNYNFTTLGGGQITSEKFEMGPDLTIAEIQSGMTLNYGVDVQSHKSNTSVGLCSATNSDCKDVFRITTRLYRCADCYGGGKFAEYSNTVTLTYNGTQTHSFTQDLSSTMLTNNNVTEVWGQMELWGVDAGYHTGYYGPVFSNPFMTLTYDAVTQITQTITQIILSDQTTVYNTSEDTITSVFIGDPTTDTTIPDIDFSDVESFEIVIVNEDTGGGIEMEFSVEVDETSNVATVEMETTNMDTGVVAIDTIVEIDLNLDFGSMDTGSMDANMPSVESIEADIGSQIDTAVGEAIAEIDMGAPDVNMDMADAGTVVEMSPPSDAGPEPTVEVEVSDSGPEPTTEVNTTESSNESSTQETVSEGESTESPDASEQATESVQESSPDAEQPVEDSGTESEGSESGDSEAGEDTSGSETESEAGDSGESGDDSEGNESSTGGEKSDRKSGDSKSSKDKSKQENKSNAEKKKEYVEKKVAEAKQKIATRILSAMADTYSAINETTKIALISSLTDTKSFQAYLDKQNALPLDWYTDTQIYTEMPMLLDPAGILYDMAQDKIMDEMIMMQYE